MRVGILLEDVNDKQFILNFGDIVQTDELLSQLKEEAFKPIARSNELWKGWEIPISRNVPRLRYPRDSRSGRVRKFYTDLKDFHQPDHPVWDILYRIQGTQLTVPINFGLECNKVEPWKKGHGLVDTPEWKAASKDDDKKKLWTDMKRRNMQNANVMEEAHSVHHLRELVSPYLGFPLKINTVP